MELIERLPRPVLTRDSSQAREKTAGQAGNLLSGIAWTVQAALLTFLAVYVLSDAAGGLADVIGAGLAGSAAVWQVVLSVVALVVPFAAAAGMGFLVRRDGGSLPLAAAATAATVLAAGLAEMGGLALMILFASA